MTAPVIETPESAEDRAAKEQFLAQEAARDRISASRDGARFHALMEGDPSAHRSESEADFDLAVMLFRGLGDEAAAVHDLMQQSGLARPKWTANRTYLGRTIARARARARALGPYRAATTDLDAPPAPLRLLTPAELADPSLLQVPDAVGPWLTWRGELTYFPGREKLGKSTCAASDARGVAQAGGRFLWLTAEESRGRVVKRLRDLGIALDAMLIPDRWPRSWEEAEALVALARPDAVYVDSLASFLAAVGERIPDTSEGEAWHGLVLRFKRWATVGRQNGEPAAGVCVLEHATKEDGGYRGSTGKGAAPDTIVTFRAVPGEDRSRRLEVVGRWGFPSRTLRYRDDATGYEEVEAGRPSELDEDGALIVRAYRPGIKLADWMAATGLPHTTFHRARRAAMDKRADGTWVARPTF